MREPEPLDCYRACIESMEDAALEGITGGPETFDAAAARAHRAIIAARGYPVDDQPRATIARARAARESLRRTFGAYLYLDPKAFPATATKGY